MGSSNKSRVGVTEAALDGYVSLKRDISESLRSASSSFTSTTFTERTYMDPNDTDSTIIASPGAFADMGNVKYATAEIRVMADTVTQARNTSELPPTQSPALDAQAIIEDYTILAQLRLARGDPALPPPEEYTRLRVEAARRIRERDARLGDEECKRAAAERVEGYLKVVGQERRYYELAGEITKERGIEGHGREMERITEEIVEAVERGIGTTAESLDLTASELDSTVHLFNSVVGSLGGMANMLGTAASGLEYSTNTLNSTAETLESTLGVMAAQIGTLNSQLLALTDILQAQRAVPDTPTSSLTVHKPHTCFDLPQTANIEDTVRREVERARREVMIQAQAPCSPHNYESLGADSGSTLRTRTSLDPHSDSSSDDTAVEGKRESQTRSRRDSEKKTRRAGKYLRIVIDRILR